MVIKFIMDLENKVWHVSGEPEPKSAILEFYIDMDPGKTKFKNFDYDFSIEGPGANVTGPGANVVSIKPDLEILKNNEEKETTFPFLSNRHFVKNLLPNEEYIIRVSCKNRREFFEDEFVFLTPFPKKPHNSWSWDLDKKDWVAPVAPPDLVWNEDSQKWILP